MRSKRTRRPNHTRIDASPGKRGLLAATTTLGVIGTALGLIELIGVLTGLVILAAGLVGLAVLWRALEPEQKRAFVVAATSVRGLAVVVVACCIGVAASFSLLRGDGQTGSAIVVSHTVRGLGEGPASLGVGQGAIWAWFRTTGNVIAVDIETREQRGLSAYVGDEEEVVINYPAGSGGIFVPFPNDGIAVADDLAWVATRRNLYVLSGAPATPQGTGIAPDADNLVARGDRAWLVSRRARVFAIQVQTSGVEVVHIDIPSRVLDIAYVNGSVWGLNAGGDVFPLPRVNVTRGVVNAVPSGVRNSLFPPSSGIGTKYHVGRDSVELIAGNGLLWSYAWPAKVMRRFDPATRRRLPPFRPGFEFSRATVNKHGLWLVQEHDGRHFQSRVTLFDPVTFQQLGSTRLPGTVEDVVLAGRSLWAVVLNGPPSPFEPAILAEVTPG